MSGVQTTPCFQRPQWEEVAGPHLRKQMELNGDKVRHKTAGRQLWEEKGRATLWVAGGRKGGLNALIISTTPKRGLDLSK